jgi:hypothetical protein
MSYEFKYRLTAKSSLATIAKAARALGYTITIDKAVTVSYMKQRKSDLREEYISKIMTDERLPEFLNEQLIEKELMAPEEQEV